MTMIKSLVLGSAAGLIAMSGAQAADLPVKAKAVEYVRICSLYGAGFFYIPGTDTCIKLGGYFASTPRSTAAPTVSRPGRAISASGNRYRDYFSSRSRMALTIDTRTATEYGVVRTFGQGDFQFNNFGSSNPSALRVPGGASTTRSPPPAAAMSRLKWCSSSSLVSPSVSRLRPTRRPGTAIRATTTRS